MISRDDSIDRVKKWILKNAESGYFGRLVIVMEGGNIVHLEQNQGLKVEDLPNSRDVRGK